MVPPDISGNQNSFLSSIDWYWMSKGTTPKRFSTVDKNTFGTPCQIRLIRGGPQIYWLSRNSASNSVRTPFPWYIVIKCLVLPIQDGQPCLKNIPLKIVSLHWVQYSGQMTWDLKSENAKGSVHFFISYKYDNITMFILRAEDSIADCSPYLVIIGPNEARDDNDNIRVANETFAQKMKIIIIITHFQVYVLLQFAES